MMVLSAKKNQPLPDHITLTEKVHMRDDTQKLSKQPTTYPLPYQNYSFQPYANIEVYL